MGLSTKLEIEMNYKRIIDRAQTLEDLASDIQNTSNNDLTETLNNIGTNWTGDNAIRFLEKGSKIKDEMNKTVSDLNKIANAMRDAAKRMYDAETRALEIATQRTYSSFGGGNGGGGFR